MSNVGLRQVDKLPSFSARPVEMQVLCLGLSRTATMSLWIALGKLGYKSYHFMEVGSPEAVKNKHLLCWREALEAKILGKGKPYGREEFDKVLGNYSAVTDTPNACFVDELIEAYPNAKVVLNVRDPDKWVASMETSYYTILEWTAFKLLALVDPVLGPERAIFMLIMKQLTGGDIWNRHKLRGGFLQHNQHIRDVVPRENLLEFQVEYGWAPLCKFLSKEVPDEPYPRINEGANAAKIHVYLFWSQLLKLAGRVVRWPLAAGGLAWGFKWMQRRGMFNLLQERLMA